MYEAHITIDPIIDSYKLAAAQAMARELKFSLGDEPIYSERLSRQQAFMTGHSPLLVDMQNRITKMVRYLQKQGSQVNRYKIEHILIDSKLLDELNLLYNQ